MVLLYEMHLFVKGYRKAGLLIESGDRQVDVVFLRGFIRLRASNFRTWVASRCDEVHNGAKPGIDLTEAPEVTNSGSHLHALHILNNSSIGQHHE